VVYKRVSITSEWAPHQLSAPRELPTTMAPPTQAQPAFYEADIDLASSAINQGQILHEAVAARTYGVSWATLHRQRASQPA
jgi:hypothetical protein